MDYEKAYKDAVRKIKSIIADKKKQGLTNCLFEGDLNEIFPELNESEDEKIWKTLREIIIDYDPNNEILIKEVGISQKQFLAWLEKQCEQKLQIEKLPFEMKTIGESLGFTTHEECDKYNQMVTDIIMSADDNGEQNPADKVEPKFHESDWVVLTAGELSTTLQIVKVDTNKRLYWFNDSSYLPIVDEECLHLWTIEDARDGDVLVYNNGSVEIILLFKKWMNGVGDGAYSYAQTFDNEILFNDWSDCGYSTHPATKEQRDLLFAKMHEAGYEWDANNSRFW